MGKGVMQHVCKRYRSNKVCEYQGVKSNLWKKLGFWGALERSVSVRYATRVGGFRASMNSSLPRNVFLFRPQGLLEHATSQHRH